MSRFGDRTEVVTWVVYRMTIHGKQDRPHPVCEQSEWDAMELSRPGYHTLIQAGITDEVVAERLARGTSGDHPRQHTAG